MADLPETGLTGQEVVLLGGCPAGGKSTLARRFVERGYACLNRDERGGKLTSLLHPLEEYLTVGRSVVLDNVYATRESRAAFIAVTHRHQVPIRFLLLETTLEQAQFNACLRMMQKYGRLLLPEDFKKAEYRRDPGLFPVHVIYRYRNDFEMPMIEEGFTSVQPIPFERRYPADWTNRAVLLSMDGMDRVGGERLRQFQTQGYLLFGVATQPGLAEGTLTEEQARAGFAEIERRLGVTFTEVVFCPHAAPPIRCYCRKPVPGLGVQLMWNHRLDPRRCLVVGDQMTDRPFADRCEIPFLESEKFFA